MTKQNITQGLGLYVSSRPTQITIANIYQMLIIFLAQSVLAVSIYLTLCQTCKIDTIIIHISQMRT